LGHGRGLPAHSWSWCSGQRCGSNCRTASSELAEARTSLTYRLPQTGHFIFESVPRRESSSRADANPSAPSPALPRVDRTLTSDSARRRLGARPSKSSRPYKDDRMRSASVKVLTLSRARTPHGRSLWAVAQRRVAEASNSHGCEPSMRADYDLRPSPQTTPLAYLQEPARKQGGECASNR
jgi:hypothetical protein